MKKKPTVSPFPSAGELRDTLTAEGVSPARAALVGLFDADTFVETGAYTKRSYHDGALIGKDADFEGVITGYGAVNGQLVFAFAQDETRMKGAVDSRHADKIEALYDLAVKRGAPVVGMFASSGADIFEGVTSMAAYARILKTVSLASDEILQIAYVRGTCIGTAAAIAAAFDFTVVKEGAPFYASSEELGGKQNGEDSWCFHGSESDSLTYIKSLINFIPDGDIEGDTNDDLNRRLPALPFSEDIRGSIAAVADGGEYIEVSPSYGPAAVTCFATIGGVKCGIVATDYAQDEGKLTRDACYKISAFLNICDSFALPVVTLVNSLGVSPATPTDAVKDLALSYAALGVPGVTVLLDHAIGAAFSLLGSKGLGCELVYALPSSEIGILPANASVAFAWNDEIGNGTTREELEAKWKASVASPVSAASTGEVDDLIDESEIRARIASALLMLTC